MTVDLEDWYQTTLDIHAPVTRRVVDNTLRLLDLLDACQVKATFFVLGAVAEAFPFVIRNVRDAGHEIASHGFGHEWVWRMTPEEFRSDLERAASVIRAVCGVVPQGYRAPAFSIDARCPWAPTILADCGYTYDSSSFPTAIAYNGSPTAGVKPHLLPSGLIEFPIATCPAIGFNLPVGGGGYLRVTPYPVFRTLLSWASARPGPQVLYIHPYELDVAELRTVLPDESFNLWRVRMLQRVGRSTVDRKLRLLARSCRWITLSDAARSLRDHLPLGRARTEAL